RFSSADAPPYEPAIERSPGYPAFLALVQTAAGRSPQAVRVVQFALLAVTACCLYCFALRFVPRSAALAAALACATYPPYWFLAACHLTETLATLLVVAALLAVLRAMEREDRASRW